MLPRLYNANTVKQNFESNNGYGFFNCVESCLVTEERNGEYSLEMTILPSDRLAQTVGIGMFIKALANKQDKPQLFCITSITVKEDGKISILANHIKYIAMQNYTEGRIGYLKMTGTPQAVMTELLGDLLIEDYPFTFRSDITVEKEMALGFTTVEKLGDIFGGKTGSLLDVFGGEYHFDNFNVSLLSKRGDDTDKVIRFGKNISAFTQSITNDNVYTHIVGVASVENRGTNQYPRVSFSTEPRLLLDRTFNNIAIVDFSSDINDYVDSTTGYHYTNVQNALNKLMDDYCKTYAKASENVSISVRYSPQLDELQDIKLCDTVKVFYPPLGISYTSKVTRVVFDSLKECYTKVDINDININLANFISKKRR